MVAPITVAAYTATAIWLVLKYRVLLSGKLPSLYVVAELLPAVAIAAAVVVVPAVPLGSSAWCPAVDVPITSAVPLVGAALMPLFDEALVWPGTSVCSAALTAAYMIRSECYGVSVVLIAVAIAAAMIRLSVPLNRCKKTSAL